MRINLDDQATAPHRFEQPLPRYLLVTMIGVWCVFLKWFPSSAQTSGQADRVRWLMAARPTLTFKLEEPDRSPRIKKYEVSVRLNGGEPYLAMFAVQNEWSSTLRFAAPPALLQASLTLEVKVAGLDENGCIIEGGAQQVERSAARVSSLTAEEVLVDMRALPQALCML